MEKYTEIPSTASCDVVWSGKIEGRVDKRILNQTKAAERERLKLVEEAKADAGEAPKKKQKLHDPFYRPNKWLHK